MLIPPLIENKHKSPSPIHHSRRPTSMLLNFPRCRCCCHLVAVRSRSQCLLSCIVIRLIVVLNIDPHLIENKHNSPSPIHHSRHPTSPPLSFTCRRCCILVVVLSHRPFLLSCIVIRLIVVLNIDPPFDRKQTQIPLSYSLQQTPYLDAVKFSSSSLF